MQEAFKKSFFHAMRQCGPWEERPQIAVACSGGKDSIALAMLAQHWAKVHGAKCVVLHVDHGMRSTSGVEAKRLREWCFARRQDCVIFEVSAVLKGQNEARRARYTLMERWCRSNGFPHLLVAHHHYDQAETVVMRMNRDSSEEGLCGMAVITNTLWGRIVRPMLLMDRKHWEYVPPVVYDESNNDLKYERVRVRGGIKQDPFLFDTLMRRCKEAESFCLGAEAELRKNIVRYVRLFFDGVIIIDLNLQNLAVDKVEAVLCRAVRVVAGKDYPPKRKKIATAALKMLQLTVGQSTTLGGCVIKRMRHQWVVLREYKRIRAIEVPSCSHAYFDNRFLVFNGCGHKVLMMAAANIATVPLRQASLPCCYVSRVEDGVEKIYQTHYSEVHWSFKPRQPLLGKRLGFDA